MCHLQGYAELNYQSQTFRNKNRGERKVGVSNLFQSSRLSASLRPWKPNNYGKSSAEKSVKNPPCLGWSLACYGANHFNFWLLRVPEVPYAWSIWPYSPHLIWDQKFILILWPRALSCTLWPLFKMQNFLNFWHSSRHQDSKSEHGYEVTLT